MNKLQFYTLISKESVTDLVDRLPTPCFIHFTDIIRKRLSDLTSTLPERFRVHYALKANPDPAIVRSLAPFGVGADVTSLGELKIALAAGISTDRIEFTGPGKTESDILQAIYLDIASINAESIGELRKINTMAKLSGRRVRVGIRVNLEQQRLESGLVMGGDTQFGIPQSQVSEALEYINTHSGNLFFTGLHVHSGSQILSSDALLSNYTSILDFAKDIRNVSGVELQKINFGGGWGISYYTNQQPLDLDGVREGLHTLFKDPCYSETVKHAECIVEPGRFLVAESGLYVTTVLYRKSTQRKNYLIVDGGMHHHYLLAGGMGQVIRRNFELDILASGQPLPNSQCVYDIAGCLCTPQDILATNVASDREILEGDRIIFFNSGAYALTASPINFLSHEPPLQVFI